MVVAKYNKERGGRFLTNTHYFNTLLHFRDITRSITIGISLTTVLYLMVNVAYITVLGKMGILDSSAVAVVSKNKNSVTRKKNNNLVFILTLHMTLNLVQVPC